MKWWFLTLIIMILILPLTYGYEKIIQYDDNEDIIISTTVYNQSGNRCLDCVCNLTIYNPYPVDNTLNQSHILANKDNGIYAINLSNNGTDLSYSTNIYPITIVCNTSQGLLGGDTREGIKVSETMFDYSALIIPVIAVAFGLLLFGFKINPQYKGMKTVAIFSSLAFFFGSIGLGWATMMKAPNYGDFKIMMVSIVSMFLMVFLAILFLWYKEKIVESIHLIGRKRY